LAVATRRTYICTEQAKKRNPYKTEIKINNTLIIRTQADITTKVEKGRLLFLVSKCIALYF